MRLARALVTLALLAAAGLPGSCEGKGKDMERVKEWFNHGSLSRVQKAAEHDARGESAGQGEPSRSDRARAARRRPGEGCRVGPGLVCGSSRARARARPATQRRAMTWRHCTSQPSSTRCPR